MFIFTAFNRDTFYAKEATGDSNRMFRSSAVLVDNDGNGHQKLRTRPARYTVSKWNWFSQFIKQEMIHVPRLCGLFRSKQPSKGEYQSYMERGHYEYIFQSVCSHILNFM
jgi:hypothetical protein